MVLTEIIDSIKKKNMACNTHIKMNIMCDEVIITRFHGVILTEMRLVTTGAKS